MPQNLLNNDRIARSCFFMLKNTTDWVETYTGKRKPQFKGGDASRAGACQKKRARICNEGTGKSGKSPFSIL